MTLGQSKAFHMVELPRGFILLALLMVSALMIEKMVPRKFP